MPTVLVAGPIHPHGLDVLRDAGLALEIVDEVSLDGHLGRVAEADAILIRTQPLTAEAIGRAGRLRFVSRHGVGYDSVDVAALSSRGIPLAIVGDVNARSVAEHALMMLLAASKRLLRYDAAVREGRWGYRNSLEAGDLNGKRLLVIGFGRIGRLVAGMVAPLGVAVSVHDPFVAGEAIRAAGADPAPDLVEALARADLVTIHAPRTGPDPLIGAAALARAKPGLVIVNTARGGLVDEAALAEALRDGRVAAAGLDVFETEPPAAGMPLAADDRVILSPHMAGLTRECAERMSLAAAANVADFFAGRLDHTLVVNRADLSPEALAAPAG